MNTLKMLVFFVVSQSFLWSLILMTKQSCESSHRANRGNGLRMSVSLVYFKRFILHFGYVKAHFASFDLLLVVVEMTIFVIFEINVYLLTIMKFIDFGPYFNKLGYASPMFCSHWSSNGLYRVKFRHSYFSGIVQCV